MADVMPDYKVEQQRLKMQIMTLKTNLERFKLEVMEMVSKRKQAIQNIKATEEAVIEHEERLRGLVQEHGQAAEPDLSGAED